MYLEPAMTQVTLRRYSVKAQHTTSKPSAPGRKTVNATQAKNAFGEIMKSVRRSEPVFIEKHGKAEAVVLNIEDYYALLSRARTAEEVRLEELREEFEKLFATMQSAKSRRAVDRLLSA